MRAPSFAEFEYVLKSERQIPVEDQTVFRLRPLTFGEVEAISGVASQLEDGRLTLDSNDFRKSRLVLNYALISWRNMQDADGKQLECKRHVGDGDALTSETLNAIRDVAEELAKEVRVRSGLNKELEKNS